MPGGVLELSTPAAASTSPCLVCTILVWPRRATSLTDSASIACSRSARTSRPSALLMTFEVTTRMSPSRRSGSAASTSAARSAPGMTSGSPATAVMLMPGHEPSSAASSIAVRAISAVLAGSRM